MSDSGYVTRVRRNQGFSNLSAGYLFPEVARRRKDFQERNPGVKVISLSVGNTTEPLSPAVAEGLRLGAEALGTREGYSGYGDEQGLPELREAIAKRLYRCRIESSEVFVSDGAKCDIARLQTLFGRGVSVAVQDPAYPVYVDGSVIAGAAGASSPDGKGYAGITYLPCSPANDFFPDLGAASGADLIYFCSPNNPTGACASREQLERLVAFALERGSIIVYDAAYCEYISDPALPRSIFEIEGARNVAIEVNSFSKPVGFTGVRLGWTVVPTELRFSDGTPVAKDWNRVMTTLFNGASNIAQRGGFAALTDTGLAEMRASVAHYKGNAAIIRSCLGKLEIESYGGTDAPYIWARFPAMSSWEAFEAVLESCAVVTTPGSGFGPSGESFLRFSAFGHREDVEEACSRLSLRLSLPLSIRLSSQLEGRLGAGKQT
jgi:LL-diaminopimelate aminotransferase